MIRSGAMRHAVTIQRQSITQDAAGQPALVWTDFATRMAAIQRAPGAEVWASAGRAGRVPAVFRLRFLEGVVPAMRIELDGRIYNILSAIDVDGRKEELLITSEELVEVSA